MLLSIEDYQRISARGRSLVEALAMPGLAGIDFEPPKMNIQIRPADHTCTGTVLLSTSGLLKTLGGD